VNQVERILKIFYSPREVSSVLKEKPDWFIPVLVLLVVSLLSHYLIYPSILKPQQLRAIDDDPRFSPAQREEIRGRLEGNIPLVAGLVGRTVVTVIWLLLGSALLWGVFSLMGGEGRFKQVFSLFCYSSLIGAVAIAVKTGLQLAKDSLFVYTSAAIAVPGFPPNSPLVRFLDNLDIFALWQLWVLTVGLGVVFSFSTKKSAIGVLSMWAVWVVASTLLFGRFMPGR